MPCTRWVAGHDPSTDGPLWHSTGALRWARARPRTQPWPEGSRVTIRNPSAAMRKGSQLGAEALSAPCTLKKANSFDKFKFKVLW